MTHSSSQEQYLNILHLAEERTTLPPLPEAYPRRGVQGHTNDLQTSRISVHHLRPSGADDRKSDNKDSA
jgi:hypothetical protein